MALCCAGWGFREYDLRDYFNAASDAGLTAVECMCAPSVPLHLQADMPTGDVRATLALARQAGVDLVAIATTCDLTLTDPVLLREEIATVERVLELAERLGAQVLTIPAGWAPEDEITEDTYGQVGDALIQLGETAGDLRLTLALQNHAGVTSTIERCAKILQPLVGMDHVGLNYDPGNFALAGQDPYHALTALQESIVYAHLKDFVAAGGEPQFVAVGQGQIDWPPICSNLETQFRGWVAVECDLPDKVEEGTRESVEFLSRYIENIPRS